ncbi:3-isopropylmalate dehydrogenase [Sporomusa malonica]|uniref:3-isopropylmalate dehydrogenase n=1 Tax=Sporomusa malonica TaxID=112901 RepID=A0A1W1YAI2_9FIRM|nr:3-isopropylmalate dehydrogenase [Sporomusa malonica]SMC33124.1 3-isopropylmalate dehydrogenase [Sporomusa malonica]
MDFKIAIIPGDGIGVDVVQEGVKVLNRIGEVYGHTFKYEHILAGGSCIDAHGTPLLDESIEICKSCNAILFGAVGGPKWDALPREQRPERGLARLRREFGLFANLRPAKIYEDLKENSPLKNRVIEKGLDLMLIRDLTGGIYFNEKGRREGKYGLEAYDMECYSVMEITRVAKKAFEIAMQRKKRVISVDKANALETSKLWRDTVIEVAKEYPEVELKHMLVDKAAMELACNPSVFDVILTTSIFGDILSDEAGVATGSVGMLASASLNESGFGLYEPIHGTAPDIAGKGIANPLATIASVAMMLEIALGLPQEAAAIDRAINQVLRDGYRTPDIYTDGTTKVTTVEMGTLTAERIA